MNQTHLAATSTNLPSAWLQIMIRSAAAAAAFMMLVACANTPRYEFVADASLFSPGTVSVIVRLKNVVADTFVEDALIEATRLDSKSQPAETPGDFVARGMFGPGAYRFELTFTTPGKWELALTAKVPGEVKPIQGAVDFTVQ